MNAADLQSALTGVAFATPSDWQTIKVPREPADIAQLAGAVIAARPGLASQQADVERTLNGLVEACAALDVLGAYGTVLDVPGGPLSATLVTSVQPVGNQTIAKIAQDLAGPAGAVGRADVRMFDLPAGPTARVERLQEWPGESREQLVSLVVHYVAEIPGSGGAMLLTFSTPALALSGQLRQVFHQIACTLHIEDQ